MSTAHISSTEPQWCLNSFRHVFQLHLSDSRAFRWQQVSLLCLQISSLVGFRLQIYFVTHWIACIEQFGAHPGISGGQYKNQQCMSLIAVTSSEIIWFSLVAFRNSLKGHLNIDLGLAMPIVIWDLLVMWLQFRVLVNLVVAKIVTERPWVGE